MRNAADVVADLTAVVDECRAERSYLGLFPAMYRSVTESISTRVGAITFHDPPTVERLMVVFADRYLDAYRTHRAGGRPSRSWAYAFEAAESRWRKSLVQHLLLGMNAHINLDLGIAAAEVGRPDAMDVLHVDFDVVNDVLFSRVDELQGGLDDVSPWMSLLDRWCGSLDEAIMKRSISVARDEAWAFALRLAAADQPARAALIEARDGLATDLAGTIVRHVSFAHVVNRIVLVRESRDVPRLIDALGRRTSPQTEL